MRIESILILSAFFFIGCEINRYDNMKPPRVEVVEDLGDQESPLPPRPDPNLPITNPMYIASAEHLIRELSDSSKQGNRIVYAWAPWCEPCKRVESQRVFDRFIEKYPYIQVYKVNVDQVDFRKLKMKNGKTLPVEKIPTVLFRNNVLVGSDQITYETLDYLAGK